MHYYVLSLIYLSIDLSMHDSVLKALNNIYLTIYTIALNWELIADLLGTFSQSVSNISLHM